MPMSKLYERLGQAAALNPISFTTAVTAEAAGRWTCRMSIARS
jgi:hypothetical protein